MRIEVPRFLKEYVSANEPEVCPLSLPQTGH